MSDATGIEWTDTTWNPVRGCSKVSPGCTNCYAERTAARFAGPGGTYEGLVRIGGRVLRRDLKDGGVELRKVPAAPRWTGEVRLVPEKLDEPLSWRKPRRVFVNSMSDLFHERLTDHEIARVFATMARAPKHTFQVLTKRPERAHAWLSSQPPPVTFAWPLPNVWLGVSVENQAAADERVPLLLQTPAAVRFLSVEPLLGPVDLRGAAWRANQTCSLNPIGAIDWVIVGGESGPGARACDVAWIRSVVEQCRAARVPVFVKQLGAFVVSTNDAGFDGCEDDEWPEDTWHKCEEHIHGYRDDHQGADVRVRLDDRKGGDPSEWPADLRVREFPEASR